jgi:hypothetical protein
MIMSDTRYVGIDIHKRHVTIVAMNQHQEELLPPKRVYLTDFPGWVEKHLAQTDRVAFEATSNSWAFHDLLSPFMAEVAVANSNKLKLISSSANKTDRHDACNLAKLHAAGLLPEVWVPPPTCTRTAQCYPAPVQTVFPIQCSQEPLVRDLASPQPWLARGKPIHPGKPGMVGAIAFIRF